MNAPGHAIKLTSALILLLAAFAALLTGVPAKAQTGDSSIEVHHRVCPTDYTGEAFFQDCHDSMADPGLPFTFSSPALTREGTTNDNGNIGFANLPAGTYSITGGAAGESDDYAVFCSVGTEADPSQEQLPVEYIAGGIRFELPATTNVICDWYTVPLSQEGEQPAQEPQVGDSSIEVHSRICPEGYQGSTWFEDCHGNVPDPGLPYTLADGVTHEGATNGNGNVGFADLPAGTYTITGGAPGEFSEYAVYCAVGTEAESNQSDIPVTYVTGGVQLDLPAATSVICDWYIVPVGQAGVPTATVELEEFALPILSLLCVDDPGASAVQEFVTTGTLPNGCEQYAGASVTVTMPDGIVLGSCVTEADAPCYVPTLVGSTVYGTQDMTTVPEGYVPIQGETQEVTIDAGSEAFLVFVNVQVQPTATIPATPTAVPLPPDRPALIATGTCGDDEVGDVVVELEDLRAPEGIELGQEEAITAETSTSTIVLSIDQLRSENHVVLVFEDDDLEATGDPVACAPIGGVINGAGELVIGLEEQNDSDHSGIVYMASATDDETQTNITVFLAAGLAEDDPLATPEP